MFSPPSRPYLEQSQAVTAAREVCRQAEHNNSEEAVEAAALKPFLLLGGATASNYLDANNLVHTSHSIIATGAIVGAAAVVLTALSSPIAFTISMVALAILALGAVSKLITHLVRNSFLRSLPTLLEKAGEIKDELRSNAAEASRKAYEELRDAQAAEALQNSEDQAAVAGSWNSAAASAYPSGSASWTAAQRAARPGQHGSE